MVKFSRQNYLNNHCTHEEYYRQLVTDQEKRVVTATFTLDRLKNSTCEHMNDIPLRSWDMLGVSQESIRRLREAGDYPTQAGFVCINKMAAKMVVEDSLKIQ